MAATNQNGKFMVTWIGGVLAGALLIGAGMYFGLSMLQKDQPSGTAAVNTGNAAPSQPQTQQRQAAVAPAVVPETSVAAPRPAPVAAPSPSAAPSPAIVQPPSNSAVVNSAQERIAADPDNIDEEPQTARAQPIAPRAATTGGIAAARLPTGEEIMVPAGVRVDEYLAEKARERGIVLEEEPRPESIIEGDEAQDVTLDTDLRSQQEIDQDDSVYQPRTPD